jgi:hypothetical protein
VDSWREISRARLITCTSSADGESLGEFGVGGDGDGSPRINSMTRTTWSGRLNNTALEKNIPRYIGGIAPVGYACIDTRVGKGFVYVLT